MWLDWGLILRLIAEAAVTVNVACSSSSISDVKYGQWRIGVVDFFTTAMANL